MKKTVKYLISSVVAIMLSVGCEDFLETTSQDLIVPVTVGHYKELLQGEGYFKLLLSKSAFVLYMTDDVEFFGKDGEDLLPDAKFLSYGDAYRWQEEIENDYMTDECYRYLYRQILTANTCIDALDEMEGSSEEKEILEGQAYFTRAFGYFLLANFYAQAYNEAALSDPCVPLVLEPTPTTKQFPRNTIKEVWTRIVTDSELAIQRLHGKNITSVYEINYGAALMLRMRIGLFMEDFDKVIEYGEKVLELNHALYDITNKSQITGTSSPTSSSFIDKFIYPASNTEILWLYDNGESESFYNLFNVNTMLTANTISISSVSSNSIISVFKHRAVSAGSENKTVEEDKRVAYWFIPGLYSFYPAYIPLKFDRYNIVGEDCQSAFRTGEAYISLAEAYVRKKNPNRNQALYYLNKLREKRITPYTYLVDADFSSDGALVDFIWEERRRELCFEEHHRWWDLRRTGQPKLTHVWQGGEKYCLAKKDMAYIINFPKSERNYNADLNNPRPKRNGEYELQNK